MPSVTREIHIGAPPDEVRRHVTDPVRRSGWLDDGSGPEGDPTVTPDGAVTWRHGGGEVRIVVAPDGEGSRVTVTERVAEPVPGPTTGRPDDEDTRPVALLAA